MQRRAAISCAFVFIRGYLNCMVPAKFNRPEAEHWKPKSKLELAFRRRQPSLPAMFSVGELAKKLHGEVIGDDQIRVSGLAPANSARRGDLTFAENAKYFMAAESSMAAAILVQDESASADKVLIRVENVRLALAQVIPLFFPEPVHMPEIHATAVVAPTAEIHPSACIGPYCVIEDHVRIGEKAVLTSHVFVGSHSEIGAGTRLFSNVSIYPETKIGARVRIHSGSVIGSDGYGYIFSEGVHHKIPQIGNVILEDDVEIGACVTIDCGALGSTVIGKGTKIDNQVQIGHNVTTGEHCLIVSQTGIAGSTELGKFVTLAGQVGIAGHLKIGDKVTIVAQSGVMHDVPDGQKWMGSPARPDKQAKRQLLAFQQLPDALQRLRQLEKQSNAPVD